MTVTVVLIRHRCLISLVFVKGNQKKKKNCDCFSWIDV